MIAQKQPPGDAPAFAVRRPVGAAQPSLLLFAPSRSGCYGAEPSIPASRSPSTMAVADSSGVALAVSR